MAQVIPLAHGPYKIEGARLMDAQGDVVAQDDTMFLCRCGLSANKPFCDGTHARQGWQE